MYVHNIMKLLFKTYCYLKRNVTLHLEEISNHRDIFKTLQQLSEL